MNSIMQKIKLLFKATNSIQLWIRSIFKWGLLGFICFILSIIIYTPSLARFEIVARYKYPEYDVHIRSYLKSSLDQMIATNKNIKKYVAFEVVDPEGYNFISDSVSITRSSQGIAGDSMRPFFDLYISPELSIDYDYDLIERDDAIFISYSLSRELKVKVGNKIQLEDSRNPDAPKKEYIVAVIYNDVYITASYFLTHYPITPDYQYNSIFISFYDVDEGIKYIYDNYYPTAALYHEFGPDWENVMTKEEKEENKHLNWVHLRTDLLEESINDIKRIKEYTLLITFATFIILFTFMIDSYRTSKNSLKEITILRMLGGSKKMFFMYFAIKTFLEQSLMFFLGHFIVLHFNVIASYISPLLILSKLPIFIGILLVSALSSGFMALYGMRFSKALKVVQSEESVT